MKIYVISGGPGTGKTSVIEELRKRGYKVIDESARKLSLTDKKLVGKSIKEIDMNYFQKTIFELQKELLDGLKTDKKVKGKIIFSDRGLGDTIAYYNFYKLKIPKEISDYIKSFKYSGIFITDFLDFYAKDKLRKESKAEQEKIHNLIIESYKKLGYRPVIVPFMSIKERADFILKRIK